MKKNNILLIIMVSFLLYSCSDADTWIEELDTSLSVTQVGFSFKSADGMTKSFFENGDEIGLQIHHQQETSYNKLTYLNSGWVLKTPILLSGNNTDIYATYPYESERKEPEYFEIEHFSQTDYLYSDIHSVNRTNPVLSLTMKHAMALIEFEFQDIPMGGGYMDFISIEGPGIYSKVKLNLFSGKMEYMSGWNDPAIIYGWQVNDPIIQHGSRVSLLIVPVENIVYDGYVNVTLVIEGSKYHWLVPSGTQWESGKKYTYRVNVMDRVLDIVNVCIQDWGDAGKQTIYLPFT